ncbi:MAG TPA: hypothetical protein VFS39_15825 [Nitrospira sp.]|nr:hypothetical protein [Nitrospira sp.]
MDIEIGSNLYRNTDGTIEVEGVPQIQIALKQPTRQLLINFALFDENGKVIAKLSDSTLMFNERRAYELTKTPGQLLLRHADSKQVVLQVEAPANGRIVVGPANFHSIKGHLVEVTAKEWKVDRQKASGTTQDMNGGAVKIG